MWMVVTTDLPADAKLRILAYSDPAYYAEEGTIRGNLQLVKYAMSVLPENDVNHGLLMEYACIEGHQEIIEYFLQHFGTLTMYRQKNTLPEEMFRMLCDNDQVEIIKNLIARMPESKLFIIACETGCFDIVEFLFPTVSRHTVLKALDVVYENEFDDIAEWLEERLEKN